MHESLVTDRYAELTEGPSYPSATTLRTGSIEFNDESEADIAHERRQLSGDTHARSKAITVSRWASEAPRNWDESVGHQQMLVALCLRQSLVTLSANGEPVFDGVIDRGAALVVPAGFDVRGRFQTPTDFLHVYVPSHWLTEWLHDSDTPVATSMLATSPLHVRDSVVIKLTTTLLRTVHGRTSTSLMYADGITLSILARVLEIIATRANVKPARVSSVSPLEAWRVKLAIEFIDQRIDQSLSLAELGAAVGLSPMHFAARFRAATGISPHTFVLRRRIEHAQTLLATTTSTVADIAFSVGFRTQAHFTTVFRRHVDDTPHRWRAKHGATRSAVSRGGFRSELQPASSHVTLSWKDESFSL